jgi:hypothetical protein
MEETFSKEWRIYRDSFALWMELLPFDKKAAIYVMCTLPYNDDVAYGSHGLSGLFIWNRTPQGHKYWSKLSEQLKRKYGRYD